MTLARGINGFGNMLDITRLAPRPISMIHTPHCSHAVLDARDREIWSSWKKISSTISLHSLIAHIDSKSDVYVCLSVRQCVVCLSVCVYACISVCLSVCMYVYMYACEYMCLSVCLSTLISSVWGRIGHEHDLVGPLCIPACHSLVGSLHLIKKSMFGPKNIFVYRLISWNYPKFRQKVSAWFLTHYWTYELLRKSILR